MARAGSSHYAEQPGGRAGSPPHLQQKWEGTYGPLEVLFAVTWVGLAERGQRRVEGPPLAGSNSDSIPMSIPTHSYYIESVANTIGRLHHLVL
jgi:hypothetical protein